MKKWIASAIAVSMTLNTALGADGSPVPPPSYSSETQTEPQPADETDATLSASTAALADEGQPAADPVADRGQSSLESTEVLAADAPPLEGSQKTETEPQVAEVSKASSDSSNKTPNRTWQRVAIAAAAVVVATIALILVANNQGHRSHSHGHQH